MPTTRQNDTGRALLIVLDGLGYNRRTLRDVTSEAWSALAVPDQHAMTAAATTALLRVPGARLSPDQAARLATYPVHAEALEEETPFEEAEATLRVLGLLASSTSPAPAFGRAREAVRTAAARRRYVPGMALAPHLERLRNWHLTLPTSAAGIWAGYEDVVPAVAGNSETGHQQIGGLSLAAQTPREITEAIKSGAFLDNAALNEAVGKGVSAGSALNFCFLLSGVQGDDGRVHSAWNHLEAFLELVFVRHHADPARVRMQAILDGRDAPPRSSLEESGGVGGYLRKLESLLERHRATESLAWVVGRSTSMDRDYREQNTRADYLLMTAGVGAVAAGFAGVRDAVARAHAAGTGDTDVPPIAVAGPDGKVRVIGRGEVFVDLNFRPDRQRAKVAALLGARDYLAQEAAGRQRTYQFDWQGAPLDLHVCTIAEYHPDFADKYGATVAFPVRPKADNLLALWPEVAPGETYALVAESVKSLHMGYFFRGRRAEAVAPGIEDLDLTPSYAERDGVGSDSDFVKYPEMRNPEVASAVVRRLAARRHRLICCNLSAPDMIGHLLPEQTDQSSSADARVASAVKAYEATDAAVGRMVHAALLNGYSAIITSDHGNIEDPGPAHSANDVLTTIVPPAGRCRARPAATYQARLFDISWTVASIICAEEALQGRAAAGLASGGKFAGRPLISPAQD